MESSAEHFFNRKEISSERPLKAMVRSAAKTVKRPQNATMKDLTRKPPLQKTWKKVKGYRLIPKVLEGVISVDGELPNEEERVT
jgi:hypothetical protein